MWEISLKKGKELQLSMKSSFTNILLDQNLDNAVDKLTFG